MTLYDHLFTHVATRIDPERAHHLGFRAVRAGAPLLRASHAATGVEGRPVEVMGLRFPHPLGLAAGFDKNAVGIILGKEVLLVSRRDFVEGVGGGAIGRRGG